MSEPAVDRVRVGSAEDPHDREHHQERATEAHGRAQKHRDRDLVDDLVPVDRDTGGEADPEATVMVAVDIDVNIAAHMDISIDMGVAPDLLTGFQSYSDGAVRSKFEKAWQVQLPAEVGNDVYQLLENKNKDLKVLFVAEHDEGIVKYEKEIANLDFVVYFGLFLSYILLCYFLQKKESPRKYQEDFYYEQDPLGF